MRLLLLVLVIAIATAENVTTCRIIHADMNDFSSYMYAPHEHIGDMTSNYTVKRVTRPRVHTDIVDVFYMISYPRRVHMISYDDEVFFNLLQMRLENTFTDSDGIIPLKNSMNGLESQPVIPETCPNVICSYNNWPYDYGQCVNADGQNQICCEDGWQICEVCDESICC